MTSPSILEMRVQKTLIYLNSDRGRENWTRNIGRGYNDYQNLFAAVQTATHLLKYEPISEVLFIIRKQWAPVWRRTA
jgi:hypothetical protein